MLLAGARVAASSSEVAVAGTAAVPQFCLFAIRLANSEVPGFFE